MKLRPSDKSILTPNLSGFSRDELWHYILECQKDAEELRNEHNDDTMIYIDHYDWEKLLNMKKLVKEEFDYYDIAFKKHKDIDDFKVAQVLNKILRNCMK